MATYTEVVGIQLQLLRNVRKLYRAADTAGEKFERYLDLLLNPQRKRIIGTKEIQSVLNGYNDYDASVAALGKGIADFNTIIMSKDYVPGAIVH